MNNFPFDALTQVSFFFFPQHGKTVALISLPSMRLLVYFYYQSVKMFLPSLELKWMID